VRKRRNRRPIAAAFAGGAIDGALGRQRLRLRDLRPQDLRLQYLNNRGGVKSANLAQVARFLQQVHVVGGVNTVAALGAMWAGQAERFPSANGRRRNSDEAGHVADFEINLSVA